MKWIVNTDIVRSDFVNDVEAESGEKVHSCYQCGKCSSGCPMAFEMDLLPNQIIRMVQLGMEKQVLNSRTIRLCVGCETCATRCPREVDLAKIMDALRIIARQKKIKSPEKDVFLFNKLFLDTVRKYGRVYEMEMVGRFNLGSGHFLKDVDKAPKLYSLGKLKLLPVLSDVKRMKKIFKEVKKLEKRKSKEKLKSQQIEEKVEEKIDGKLVFLFYILVFLFIISLFILNSFILK